MDIITHKFLKYKAKFTKLIKKLHFSNYFTMFSFELMYKVS